MDAGLRGFSVGDAQVSKKHCGFVINRGNATAADVMALVSQVQTIVEEVRCPAGIRSEKELEPSNKSSAERKKQVEQAGGKECVCDCDRHVRAGKTTALKMLEDMGYFCVDNLPISLIEKFAELTFTSGGEVNKVALGIDIRSGRRLWGDRTGSGRLTMDGRQYEILFLDAADDVLVKRYKERRDGYIRWRRTGGWIRALPWSRSAWCT